MGRLFCLLCFMFLWIPMFGQNPCEFRPTMYSTPTHLIDFRKYSQDNYSFSRSFDPCRSISGLKYTFLTEETCNWITPISGQIYSVLYDDKLIPGGMSPFISNIALNGKSVLNVGRMPNFMYSTQIDDYEFVISFKSALGISYTASHDLNITLAPCSSEFRLQESGLLRLFRDNPIFSDCISSISKYFGKSIALSYLKTPTLIPPSISVTPLTDSIFKIDRSLQHSKIYLSLGLCDGYMPPVLNSNFMIYYELFLYLPITHLFIYKNNVLVASFSESDLPVALNKTNLLMEDYFGCDIGEVFYDSTLQSLDSDIARYEYLRAKDKWVLNQAINSVSADSLPVFSPKWLKKYGTVQTKLTDRLPWGNILIK